jgi:signal transduction histidine kinase
MINQIFEIFNEPPGSFVYQMVLVFSIAIALQAAFVHYRTSQFPQTRRALLGLLVLLFLQLVHFAIGTLASQGLFGDPEVLLPPLDRAITALNLIWAAWLWTFPEPSRPADLANGVLSVLVLIFLVIGIFAWGQVPVGVPFNTDLQNTLWQIFSLMIIGLAALILFIRQPNGWGMGAAFLGLAFLGHVAHLLAALLGEQDGDYAGIVRLMYMSAYPILTTIPQRFPSAQSVPDVTTTIKQTGAPEGERRRYSVEPKTFHALLALAGELNAVKISHAMTCAIAQTMLADLCFLIYLTEDRNQLVVASGYDLIREENLDGGTIERNSVPSLANALQRGRALRLPASGTSPDLKGLSDLLGLSAPGHLLAVPILKGEKEAIGGVLLLSPYSNRMWSPEDQTFLSNITPSLLPVIERSQRIGAMESHGSEARQELEKMRDRFKELELQNKNLADQLAGMEQKAGVDQEQAEKMATLLAFQQESQNIIDQLQKENETLRAARSKAGVDDENLNYLEEQLRLTLKEVAHLQNQLAEANIKVLEMEKAQAQPRTVSSDQAEVVASISQELRQPMSSIVGYTDLLLGESVGILGALQRKFVERIKSSTERIGSLIDDLIQITTIESGLSDLKPEAVDLNLIIDNAMAYTSSQLREKNIALNLDLPKNLSFIQADREALQQILIHLLQNAGAATPVDGTITLRVQTRNEDGKDYVLIQVSDTGGGIPSEDIPRVFSRLYRADNVLIQGVGDTGVGLSIAKTLTEAQHGRIWVETQGDVGATFSVLLPIAGNGHGKGE